MSPMVISEGHISGGKCVDLLMPLSCMVISARRHLYAP